MKHPIVDDDVNYAIVYKNGASFKRKKSKRQVEVPMEERLNNLSLNKMDDKLKMPLSHNAHLLIQGLQSKDKQILRTVLSTKDETVIRNTVKRLPMTVIEPLVTHLTTYVEGKTEM